jgi:hypothetical protein
MKSRHVGSSLLVCTVVALISCYNGLLEGLDRDKAVKTECIYEEDKTNNTCSLKLINKKKFIVLRSGYHLPDPTYRIEMLYGLDYYTVPMFCRMLRAERRTISTSAYTQAELENFKNDIRTWVAWKGWKQIATDSRAVKEVAEDSDIPLTITSAHGYNAALELIAIGDDDRFWTMLMQQMQNSTVVPMVIKGFHESWESSSTITHKILLMGIKWIRYSLHTEAQAEILKYLNSDLKFLLLNTVQSPCVSCSTLPCVKEMTRARKLYYRDPDSTMKDLEKDERETTRTESEHPWGYKWKLLNEADMVTLEKVESQKRIKREQLKKEKQKADERKQQAKMEWKINRQTQEDKKKEAKTMEEGEKEDNFDSTLLFDN